MTIPCHCLIKHPEKPKFLVIKHQDRWSPPVLQLPEEGALMYKAPVINKGMMQKYSFRTTVLRILLEAQNYALVELEMHGASQQQMQAVWVGLEEYGQFGNWQAGEDDPIEKWLKQQQQKHVSPLRAPWERPGWFRKAEQWVTDRLIENGTQVSGSVQQYKAGWPTACLLRVSTVRGNVYFKAAYSKPPGEARLTPILAEHWPDMVVSPLAVDEQRNWMLMRDFRIKHENKSGQERYPDFARTLGQFQVEAMEKMDTWRALSCPVMDLAYLRDEDGRAGRLVERMIPVLAEDPEPFDAEEIGKLQDAIAASRPWCDELQRFDIPDSLAHLDFRPGNFFVEKDKCRVIDWADVAVTHPFMALCRTLDFFEQHGSGEFIDPQADPLDEEVMDAVREAYLSAFSGNLQQPDLGKAFESARAVFPLFWFLYTAAQCQIIEPRSPQGDILRNLAKVKARNLISRHEI